MSTPAIEFRAVTKEYRSGFWGTRQKALDGLSLTVPSGCIYGFLGANGAGKTTGIKILMGLQFPSAGDLRIFGGDIANPDTKSRIGYLPERPYFHDSLDCEAFLNFHRALFGTSLRSRKIPTNAELLELVGLSHAQDKALKDFSKGMLQRIGIAQALVNNPDLVVLDEPMSGLDPVGRKDVRDLILQLSARGKTVFFSSHILSDVESICHRIAFLEKGVLRHEGALQGIRNVEGTHQEITFTGLASAAVKSSRILAAAAPSGESFLFRAVDPGSARAAIEEIWRLGGSLVSAVPEHKSLEEFLFGERKKP